MLQLVQIRTLEQVKSLGIQYQQITFFIKINYIVHLSGRVAFQKINFSRMRTFKVFFVYAFTSKENYYSRSDIISVIEEVCEIAQSDSKNKNIKVVPDFYFNEFGNNLQ